MRLQKIKRIKGIKGIYVMHVKSVINEKNENAVISVINVIFEAMFKLYVSNFILNNICRMDCMGSITVSTPLLSIPKFHFSTDLCLFINLGVHV